MDCVSTKRQLVTVYTYPICAAHSGGLRLLTKTQQRICSHRGANAEISLVFQAGHCDGAYPQDHDNNLESVSASLGTIMILYYNGAEQRPSL